MRLIDVDKLIEYFDGDLEGYDNREYILHMLDTKGRIERIKAIPIEWMKQWAMKNWVKSKKCEYDIVVSKMLDDWEKENETN